MDLKGLPDDLIKKVEYLSNFQRNYCYWRAKNLPMATSSQRAGSKAKTRDSLAKVGYQIEQIDGVKEFIAHLVSKRSTIASIDENDLLALLKDVYEQSMQDGNWREANKSAETMAKCLGMLTRNIHDLGKKETSQATGSGKTDNNEDTSSFTEDLDDIGMGDQTSERIERLQTMMKEINKSKK